MEEAAFAAFSALARASILLLALERDFTTVVLPMLSDDTFAAMFGFLAGLALVVVDEGVKEDFSLLAPRSVFVVRSPIAMSSPVRTEDPAFTFQE